MQTKPKANSVITHALVGQQIHFNVKGAGSIMLDMGDLSDEIVKRAAIHGMIQRISDAAAISRNPETGLPATPLEKLEAMQALVDHYASGTPDWSRVGQAGPRGGILFKALCRMFDGTKSAEEVRTWLDGKTKAEQAALRVSPKVKAIIDQLEAESGKAGGVDAESLLDELNDA